MKVRPSSRLRLRLSAMLLLNKLLLSKIGSPAEAAILSGAPEVVVLSGVLKVVILIGPPPPLLLPPPRMLKSLPTGLTAVPGTVKRKSQTTR